MDGSCACIVFVMKPPRPPVQALVDSRSVIFCEKLNEEREAKTSTQSKELHRSKLNEADTVKSCRDEVAGHLCFRI